MKYMFLLLVLVFSSAAFSQTVTTGTERKVTVSGGDSYSSFKSNDEALKSATSLAAQYCAANQNTVVYYRFSGQVTCVKSSSSKSSAASSARSSSAQPASSQSSVSSSAESAKLSMYSPKQYENGATLPAENIVRYEAIVYGAQSTRYVTIQPMPDPIIAPIGVVADTDTMKVTAVALSEDKSKELYSNYATVLRE